MNESIAPNEYIVERKSTFPGRSVIIGTRPAKKIREIHGVRNFEWMRRKTSGSWR